MSRSSLWVMDKEFFGSEHKEFKNSWLFSPIAWDALFEKYLPYENRSPYSQDGKKGLMIASMSDESVWQTLNIKINASKEQADRIVWEIANQQIFYTKDKSTVSEMIRRFFTINSRYNANLTQEHIRIRWEEIANSISEINEEEYPYFVIKNTSVDDNVERWFVKYDDEDEYNIIPLSELEEYVAEFVIMEGGSIVDFIPNTEFKYE